MFMNECIDSTMVSSTYDFLYFLLVTIRGLVGPSSFKTLLLSLRGDRTGIRVVLGDRVLQHPWKGLLKVQVFRTDCQ
jgi:hypothetical protein